MIPTMVIGQGKRFATPALTSRSKAIGVHVEYSHPTFDIFYSPHGFCYPLTIDTGPFHILMNGLEPHYGEFVKAADPVRRWLRVDHAGNIWRVLVQRDEDGDLIVTNNAITSQCGWWVTSDTSDVQISEPDRLTPFILGFLHSMPSEDKINKFWLSNFGEDLVWFSVDEITTKLNAESKAPLLNPRLSGIRQAVQKLVGDIVDRQLDKQGFGKPRKKGKVDDSTGR